MHLLSTLWSRGAQSRPQGSQTSPEPEDANSQHYETACNNSFAAHLNCSCSWAHAQREGPVSGNNTCVIASESDPAHWRAPNLPDDFHIVRVGLRPVPHSLMVMLVVQGTFRIGDYNSVLSKCMPLLLCETPCRLVLLVSRRLLGCGQVL